MIAKDDMKMQSPPDDEDEGSSLMDDDTSHHEKNSSCDNPDTSNHGQKEQLPGFN